MANRSFPNQYNPIISGIKTTLTSRKNVSGAPYVTNSIDSVENKTVNLKKKRATHFGNEKKTRYQRWFFVLRFCDRSVSSAFSFSLLYFFFVFLYIFFCWRRVAHIPIESETKVGAVDVVDVTIRRVPLLMSPLPRPPAPPTSSQRSASFVSANVK